jgi:hypothetical protein
MAAGRESALLHRWLSHW